VRGVAALAPAAGESDVVDAAQAERQREEIGALEGEVRSVERAHAAAGEQDLGAVALGVDERDDVLEDPVLVGAVAARALLERDAVVRPAPLVEAVDGVDLDAARLDQPGDRADHPVLLPVPGVAALGREDDQRPAPVPVGEHGSVTGLQLAAPYVHARRRSSARCGWSASRHEIQLCASGCSTRRTSQPWLSSASASARLFCRFSSALPHVIVVGTRAGNPAPRWAPPTKRVIRPKRSKPDSWGSKRCRKKLPDCRNRPPASPGFCQCACSAASPPRLAPISTGARRLGAHVVSAGRRSAASAFAYRAPAEYVSFRSGGGGSSAARIGETSPNDTRWSSRRSSDEYSAYSGPSWTTSSGNGSVGSVSAADQRKPGIVACSRRLSSASSWRS